MQPARQHTVTGARTPGPLPDMPAAHHQPPALRSGSRVALVSPAGPPTEQRLSRGAAHLRNWGLDVVVAPHARATQQLSYLAGSDRDRAADLQSAWLDPSIEAVLCTKGGYGAQRLIEYLDFAAMGEARPKIFAGYSDITALHEAFSTQLGVPTLHAPMPACEPFLSSEISRRYLHQALFGAGQDVVLKPQTLDLPAARTLIPGRAEGVTAGGCLSLLAAEIGTPTSRPGAHSALVVLEDIDETPDRIDRMLTQLLRCGWFAPAAGIVIGSWHNCGDTEEIDRVVVDRLGPLNIPIITDFGFGHGPVSMTVPLGVAATLDTEDGSLRTAWNPPPRERAAG